MVQTATDKGEILRYLLTMLSGMLATFDDVLQTSEILRLLLLIWFLFLLTELYPQEALSPCNRLPLYQDAR